MEKQPVTQLGSGDVSKYALLPGDPARVGRIAKFLRDSKKIAENREFITFNGSFEGIRVTVTSTGVGCAGAAMVIEELANLGAKYAIRVGTTGAIQDFMRVGDIVIATGAVRGDGATRYYAPIEFPAIPDYSVVHALVASAKKQGVPLHIGTVWTCEAFYVRPPLVDTFKRLNVLSVEMECSSIFTLSSVRGLKSGAILAVDGNLATGEKYNPWDKRVQEAIDKEILIALNAICILEKK